MTTDISTLQSAPGKITFTVWTDAGGCNEKFTASFGGSVVLTLNGAGSHSDQSIPHGLTGLYDVVVTADSGVFSDPPTPLKLTQAKPSSSVAAAPK